MIDARHKFDQEIRESWPEETIGRYTYLSTEGGASTQSELEREKGRRECDALLAQADVACIGSPYPLNLAARAPRLKWVHHTNVGASNLNFGDLYQNPSVVVTTSRGFKEPVPIAEYVMAAAFAFAKEIPRALMDKQTGHLRRQNYHPVLLQGKTISIVGLGGIEREVARLAKREKMSLSRTGIEPVTC